MNNTNNTGVDLTGLNRSDLLQLVAAQQSQIINLQQQQQQHQFYQPLQQQPPQQQQLSWLACNGALGATTSVPSSNVASLATALLGGHVPSAADFAATQQQQQQQVPATSEGGGLADLLRQHNAVVASQVIQEATTTTLLQQQQQGQQGHQDPLVSTLAQLLGQQASAPPPSAALGTAVGLGTTAATTRPEVNSFPGEDRLLRALMSGGGGGGGQPTATALLSHHLQQGNGATPAIFSAGALDAATTTTTTTNPTRIPEVSSLSDLTGGSVAQERFLRSLLVGGAPHQHQHQHQQHVAEASLLTNRLVSGGDDELQRRNSNVDPPSDEDTTKKYTTKKYTTKKYTKKFFSLETNNSMMAAPQKQKKQKMSKAVVASAAPPAPPVATTTTASTGGAAAAATKKKTKRPLSAYNIFFKEEHAKIIAQKEQYKAEQMARGEEIQSSDDDYSVEEDSAGNKTGRKRKRSLSTNQPGKRGKRQVDFENLTKVIGKRWKELPQTKIDEYRKRAEQAMQAYRKELFQKIRNSVKEDQN